MDTNLFLGGNIRKDRVFLIIIKIFFVATIHAYVGGASGKNEREKIRKING